MAISSKRDRTFELSSNDNQHHQMNENGDSETLQIQGSSKISEYEQCREERIKENLERMQKLGIFDLSLKVKSLKSTPKRTPKHTPSSGRRASPSPAPFGRTEPVRRSTRLQNSTPISYTELPLGKKDSSLEDDHLISEGSKPEVYTEKHEKMLGSTEKSWTLFVDGCGKDGKRIYDPVNGKTCHQCRQKTLGHRTHCSRCNMVQGQFCGDCLYMRYGEHVLEAKENPDWICPVCRGICNCSLCRHAKGWPATGTLYKKISKLGYKSVAHYLVETQRSEPESSKNSGTKVPTSAKRSLPFTDLELPPPVNLNDKMDDVAMQIEKKEEMVAVTEEINPTPAKKKPKLAADSSVDSEDVVKVEDETHEEKVTSKVADEGNVVVAPECEENAEAKMGNVNNSVVAEMVAKMNGELTETKVDSSVLSTTCSPKVDSIGGRLGLRRSSRIRNCGSPSVF